jgi:hypothetical protein
MIDLTFWWVVRLLMIGFAFGLLFAYYFLVPPIFDGWEACINGWGNALESLHQCVSACNPPASNDIGQPDAQVIS